MLQTVLSFEDLFPHLVQNKIYERSKNILSYLPLYFPVTEITDLVSE